MGSGVDDFFLIFFIVRGALGQANVHGDTVEDSAEEKFVGREGAASVM